MMVPDWILTATWCVCTQAAASKISAAGPLVVASGAGDEDSVVYKLNTDCVVGGCWGVDVTEPSPDGAPEVNLS